MTTPSSARAANPICDQKELVWAVTLVDECISTGGQRGLFNIEVTAQDNDLALRARRPDSSQQLRAGRMVAIPIENDKVRAGARDHQGWVYVVVDGPNEDHIRLAAQVKLQGKPRSWVVNHE
jgi:hypothetical protein